MSDSDIQHCKECGSELPQGVPPGLCPRCVLADTQDIRSEISQPLFEEDKQHPRSFGDYEIIEEIARGGMGIVYKARQKSLERLVAIKMLLFGNHATADAILRFRGEAVMAGALHHPHIVPIHEIGIHEGQHFIVMDYVDGPNLSVFLRTEPISIRETVLCLSRIATAIDYAHERNVLHRDLKPSNVLLDSDGEPHVTDFGLARKIDGESTITISGQVLGSPNYMPPEQASPRQWKVSRRSDVYGLGAILYHCLTGRPPFQAETLEATLHQVLAADPISPRLLNPSVPLDLETICLKCLEKEPSRRYGSAQELAAELTRFLDNRPIQARPITRGEKVARWCRRNPPLATAIGAAALFLFSGFLVSMWQTGQTKSEANSSRLNLYVADMNLAHQALRQNNFSSVREKLLAHLPKRGWPDLRGWEWRYLWKQIEPNYVMSFDAGEPAPAIALAPDGTIAAVARRDGQVRVLDFIRQQFTTNLSAGIGQAMRRSIAYAPNGSHLAMIDGNRLLVARPGLWNKMELVASNPASLFSVLFAPDGRHVFASSSRGLKSWDVLSGKEIAPPVTFRNDCRLLDISLDGQWFALSTSSNLMAWNLSRGTRVLSRPMGDQQIPALTLSRGGLLAACDRDGWVRIWDLPALRPGAGVTNWIAEWNTGAAGPNYGAAFSSDGNLLALAGSDQLIRLYATSNWQQCASFKGHQSEVWALAFAQDNTRLVSAGKDGFVLVWDPRVRPLPNTLAGAVFPLGFTPDSRQAVTRSSSNAVQFWDVATRTLHHTLPSITNIKSSFLEITADGRTLVAKDPRNTIHVLDLESGEHRGVLKVDTNGLEVATPSRCSLDSQFVSVATKRKQNGRSLIATELFNLKTGERIATVDGLRGMLFSWNGRFLGGKTSTQQPVAWDIQRRRLQEFYGSPGETFSVAFSHNGRLFAASSGDGVISIWDLASGKRPSILKGHRAGVGKILFSQDDRTIFSTSTDRTLRLWNVATGQEMLSLSEGDDTWELALSADDTVLAVGGLEVQPRPPVRLFQAPALREIDEILKAGSR